MLFGPAQADNAQAGSFEILSEAHRESAPGPDLRLFQTRRVITFKLRHDGKPITFTAAPHSDGSKVDAPGAVLDKAYFLDGPSDAAALVAANGSSFLVTESQGRPVVTRLLASAFKGYQWLDSAAGAPGELQFEPPQGADKESRKLGGGKLLLLYDDSGIKLGVLDVPNRAFHALVNPDPLLRSSQETYADGYRANGMLPGRARALSPNASQFVMAATKYEGDRPVIALIVVDFKQHSHKIVSLDVDATRLNALQKLTPQWIDRYYIWARAPDGTESLAARRPPPNLPWTGFLTDRRVESAAYRLLPVTPEMKSTFVAYLESRHGAVRLPPKPGQTSLTVRIGVDQFDVTFYESNHTLVFEPTTGLYTESAIAACRRIAAEFDRELEGGGGQPSFGRLAVADLWAER